MLAGILFDLDQTLFDRTRAFEQLVAAELDRKGVRGGSRARVCREIDRVDEAGYGERGPLLACLGAHFGWPQGDLEGTFRRALVAHIAPFEGAVHVLRTLGRRVRLGLLTDGSPAMQDAKIDRLGIRDLFDRVQISGSFGASKPDRAAFAAFADEWGVESAALCMVGDHPQRDIDGALAAGMHAVIVGPTQGRTHARAMRADGVAQLLSCHAFTQLLPAATAEARA